MPQPASVSPDVLTRLRRFIPEDTLQLGLQRLALLTANPENALVHGENWFESYSEEQGTTPDIAPHLDWLLPAWASGGFLSRLLVRRPWLFDRFAASEFATKAKPALIFERELWQRVEPLRTFEELSSALRGYKQEEIFFIGARDLAGRLTVAEVTSELSALASSSVEAAYRFIRRMLSETYGEPMKANGEKAAFAVLGMGKLGGGELNFSSDIDLIYLFDEEGETAGGSAGRIANSAFFNKLALKLTSAINDVTADGFVFRVDMRLRPEGTQGPLVVPVAAAESYYMNWGQTWERAAMLKARPVAGDLILGDDFLAAIESFVYRRHLDYSTVEDIKLMKQKINASLGRTVSGAWDVKLGIGGIREIEFVAQTLLLVHAGKQKALRTRSTVEALYRLESLHLLEVGDAKMLAEAYGFHRRLEHRLQIEQERQTQRLPDAPEAHLRMARLMGYTAEDPNAAVRQFEADLERHREAVQVAYRKLFDVPAEELTQGIHPAVLAVTHGEGADADREQVLGTLGFADPHGALESMRRLSEAPENRRLDSKGRRYLERIMPRFLSECIASPDPDMALSHLEDFIGRVSGWSSYHSLLAENPGTLKLLVRFFGTSAFLSRFFIKHPELLDQLVLATYATPLKDATRMHMELSRAFAEAEDEEQMLDVLRHYKNAEVLRIAINDIDGQLDVVEVTTQLADLADVVLRRAMRMAHDLVAQRLGTPPSGAELVTLGMGKFGGREMNYTSDLDLIFIYSGEGNTVGGRGATMPEFFSRVVQRLISALTLVTREGLAYPIDTRLRPSGNAGPLVTSLKSFEAYHEETAQIWERQALIRARPIAGTEGTATHIREVLEHAVYERPFGEKEMAEIARIRKRMESEIDPDTDARFNVKTGLGGIVDIEFVVQTLQLRHGGAYHSLRTPNTFAALGELFERKLIAEEDYRILRDGYLFLRRLENRMRILSDTAKTTLPNDALALEKLALSMNYPRGRQKGEAGGALLTDFVATRGNIREVFNRYFENR